jgi:RNA polymerase sigma-70 factor (ECF subfamily)
MSGFKSVFCQEMSDRDIVRMSLTNVDYFECLVLRYEEKLLKYIKNISLTSHDEAEDILQEAFIKIWKNLHGFDQQLSLENWVFRIVHNETISFWRKKLTFGKDKIMSLDQNPLITLKATEQTNHDDLENIAKTIHEILPQLKLEYREVLVLKYLEDKSYEEISDILKIPEGTVATRINRAKKSFRELSKGKLDFTIFNA